MIIERIENDNGTAIKFDDGTMICYGFIQQTFTASDLYNFCNRTSKITINFPLSFIQKPIVTISSRSFGIFGINLSVPTTSYIEFYGYLPKEYNVTTIMVNYIAIGRWK